MHGDNHVLLAPAAFNLLMGRRWPPEQTDLDEATAACQELGLGPLLERMPAGLGQTVGETGWRLSKASGLGCAWPVHCWPTTTS